MSCLHLVCVALDVDRVWKAGAGPPSSAPPERLSAGSAPSGRSSRPGPEGRAAVASGRPAAAPQCDSSWTQHDGYNTDNDDI